MDYKYLGDDKNFGFTEYGNSQKLFFQDRTGPAIQAINGISHCVFNKAFFNTLIDIFESKSGNDINTFWESISETCKHWITTSPTYRETVLRSYAEEGFNSFKDADGTEGLKIEQVKDKNLQDIYLINKNKGDFQEVLTVFNLRKIIKENMSFFNNDMGLTSDMYDTVKVYYVMKGKDYGVDALMVWYKHGEAVADMFIQIKYRHEFSNDLKAIDLIMKMIKCRMSGINTAIYGSGVKGYFFANNKYAVITTGNKDTVFKLYDTIKRNDPNSDWNKCLVEPFDNEFWKRTINSSDGKITKDLIKAQLIIPLQDAFIKSIPKDRFI